MEATMTMEMKPVAGLLLARNPTARRLPRTREEFRLAANWLARQAVRAGNVLSAALGGPDKDDAAAGICLGYRDGRDAGGSEATKEGERS